MTNNTVILIARGLTFNILQNFEFRIFNIEFNKSSLLANIKGKFNKSSLLLLGFNSLLLPLLLEFNLPLLLLLSKGLNPNM